MCRALVVVVDRACVCLVCVVVCNCRWKSVSFVCVVVGCCLLCVVIIRGLLVLLSVGLEFDSWCMLHDVVVGCGQLSVCLVSLRVVVARFILLGCRFLLFFDVCLCVCACA